MVKATTTQGVTTFAYDPLGRRIAKHGTRGKTLFGWDGDVLAFESSDRRSVYYVHEAGSFVPLAQATRQGPIALTASAGAKELMGANGRYDINRDPLWNGEAEKPAGPGFTKEEIAYYQCDHLGTPQELTDHDGNVVWAAQYKAWGQAKEVISEAARRAGIANPIRFQGQYWDDEIALHYNRYRWYDPQSGRFVSKDPIGLWGGIHLFAYAANSTAWVDPLGLAKKSAKQKQGSPDPQNGTPGKTCAHAAVVNALNGYQSKRFQFGNNVFLLDKSAMTHILKRHHPEYWDGSVKKSQTFLCPETTIAQIEAEIEAVLKENGSRLKEGNATTGMYQLEGKNGRTVGLKSGRIGQFY
jgi:RHS repeat-associated protein